MLCSYLAEDAKVLVGNYAVQRDHNGVPTFPRIDFNKESLDMIRKVIEAYFHYLWGTSHISHISLQANQVV